MSALVVQAGNLAVLYLDFYDEQSGALTDPDSIELDITYGTEVGLAPDIAGPFTYQGASSQTPGQVWRIGAGQYACQWQVPASTPSGVYVANWTCGYGSDTFLGVENFIVAGGTLPATAAQVDTGFWSGSISYGGESIQCGQVDADGIAWLWQKLEGWDGPDVSGGVIQRSGDHGGWPSPQFFQPRNLTWTLTAVAPTQALRDQARAFLASLVPVSDLAVLEYDEPVPKIAYVRRSGKLTEKCQTLTDCTFTVGLVAPDPRKYSAAEHSTTGGAGTYTTAGLAAPFTAPFTLPAQPPSNSVLAPNAGNFGSPPVVVITGPIVSPALQLVETGETVSWTGLELLAGQQLVVDFNAKLATISGSYRPADVSSAWWALQPGTNTVQLSGSYEGWATFEVIWRDAWI